MKTILNLSIFLLAVSLFTFLPHTAIANVTEWHLPEGAKARLGKGSINEITYSPDGKLLAVASSIGIWLYDAHSGETLNLITEDMLVVYSVAFSPDGRTLASGNYDETVRLWDVQTGVEKQILRGHTNPVYSVVFSPDGQTIASGGDDETVRLWDVQTAVEKQILTGHTDSVLSVDFSPDGQTIASGSRDRTVRLWDVQTATEKQILTGHRDWLRRVVFSPDGQTLASVSANATVRLWDVQTGVEKQVITGLYSVSFSPDGQTIASGGQDKTVRLWDVQTGVEKQVITGHADRVFSVVFSPDGQTIASESGDSTVRLWDVQTGVEKQVITGHAGSVYSVVFSPDGQTIASGGLDNTVRLWDVQNGVEKQILTGHRSLVYSVVFSPDGQTIASGSGDSTVRLWDVQTAAEKQILTGHTDYVRSVAFSPDGQTIASGSDDETVRLWDVQTEAEKQILTGHVGDVLSVVFSPDGQTIASGSDDRTVRLWDVQTEAEKQILTGHVNDVNSVSFSPDGQTIASGGGFGDNTVRLWDVQTGVEKQILTGHAAYVHSVAFSPDGQTLASSGWDATVLLWALTADVNAVRDLVAYYPFEGNSEDASGNDNHGQIIGTTTYVEGKFGDAIALDGGVYVEMETSESLHGDLFKADPFTLAVWIYSQTGVGYEHVWRSLPVRSGHNTLFIFEDTGIISWRGNVDGVWSWGNLCETDPGVFETETWVHVAVTNDGDKFRIYADGEKVAETDFQETDGGNAIYRIGDFSNPLTIDDYAVFSKALSEAEINLIMKTGVAQFLQTTQSADIEDSGFAEDVNGDGTVNIQDLVAVAAALGETGENDADVNGDGIVDIRDLVAVAAALGEVAAAPAAIRQQGAAHLTQEEVQHWLTQAQQADLTDATSLRGIRFLKQLLSAFIPKETALLPNYPNPFNPETWIPYQLATHADVKLTIYDIQGRVVRDLDLGHQRAGMYHGRSRAAYWDGRNAVGEPVASGVYFYTLTAGDFTATRKMLILK